MTAKAMIKKLEKVVAKHGNIRIGVDRGEIGVDISGVKNVVVDDFYVADGDGFIVKNVDGSERSKCIAVIY